MVDSPPAHARAVDLVRRDPALIRATISAATHTGWVRERNEDWFAATGLPAPNGDGDAVSAESIGSCCLAVVADGLGGHPAGDVASQLAIESLFASCPGSPGSLVDALHTANEAIYDQMSANNGNVGMGATIAVVLITQSEAAVANVGDTKAFEFADGVLRQLTVDDVPHDRVQLLGLATPIVTQSLGGRTKFKKVHPHLARAARVEQQRILICSDGLTSFVPSEAIRGTLNRETGSEAVRQLIGLALAAGGRDNITVVLIET
ncbi:PP2C family protein-serine/threonine phosphatase [Candidatus Poriferisodalis sp.]|uniref:PP2C family protein-serine/threonine phosphatase n=1 Tax=Candidatus Poriferisodalis sp. TaxID=3101277 RepID=UPI003B011D2C